MERRKFIQSIAACSASLSLLQCEKLLAAAGFHGDGPYNGPLATTWVNSTCGACAGGCGIRVRKIDGIPVKINGNPMHPVNRGGLCPVGASSLAFLVHADRIRKPLLRSGPRGSGEYQEIDWTQAEDILVEKLSELQKAKHPEQLLFLDGRPAGPAQELVRKFVSDFGSPNYYNVADPVPSVAASIWGGPGTKIGYDLENARIIYSFGSPIYEGGSNPIYHAGLRSRLLAKSEGKRGSVFVIDSRLSVSATKAERWIPIQPGTHGLLALGMLYLIIKEQLYDRDAVEKNCVGFDDRRDQNGRDIEGFKNFVLKNYYPSFVAEHSGVPVDQIIWLARKFANTPGAVALAGANALGTIDGVYQAWAIQALNAITGRFGVEGGVGKLELSPLKNQPAAKLKAERLVSAANDDFPYLADNGAIEEIPERILSASPNPIKLAIFNGANPVYHSAQSNRFRQALQNIPFSVVFASLKDETSELADLILPECTFLERNDLVLPSSDFSNPVVSVMQPVIQPLYESRQSEEVFISLGKKILSGDWQQWSNYPAFLKEKIGELYRNNSGTIFTDKFKVSFESLLAERGWRRAEFKDITDFSKQLAASGGWWTPARLAQPNSRKFPTASGKFYFNSAPLRRRVRKSKRSMTERLHNAGLSPVNGSDFMLGAYRKFEHDPESRFPLALYVIDLTTMRGDGGRLHAMADMVGYFEDVKWQSWVELNPESAHELGLHHRQMVTVESANGKQQVILIINPGLVPNVAAIPAGLGKHVTSMFGKNVCDILSPARELFTGMAATRETWVKVYA